MAKLTALQFAVLWADLKALDTKILARVVDLATDELAKRHQKALAGPRLADRPVVATQVAAE